MSSMTPCESYLKIHFDELESIVESHSPLYCIQPTTLMEPGSQGLADSGEQLISRDLTIKIDIESSIIF